MSTNYPEHNIPFFYKYYSAETAKIVLSNKTLRYSSPMSFNDPFDIQTELYFNFNIDDFAKRFFPKFQRILRGEDWSSAKLPFYLPKIPSLEWESLPKDVSQQMIQILLELMTKTQNDYNEHWRSLLPKLRVFCISEINDSILMWSHYAQYHYGVCFKLRVIPESDNHLCAAKKVIYTETPPSVSTVFENLSIDDWVDIFLGKGKNRETSDFTRFVLFKSCFWSYEKEWRVWFPSEIEQYSKPFYMKLNENELDTIFFGCNCKKEDVKEIQKLAKAHNPGISFYQGIKDTRKYKINFAKL